MSDDGPWIAFIAPADLTGQNHDESLEVFVLRPDGSDLIQLTDDPAPNARAIASVAIHAQAIVAAEAALAAHAQGKVGEMHKKLLESNRALSREKVTSIAKEIGLDLERFGGALDTRAHKAAIDAQTREVVAIGATGTPAFFVNGRSLVGGQLYEAFERYVDEEIAKAAATRALAP